jgi:hypothetical protein
LPNISSGPDKLGDSQNNNLNKNSGPTTTAQDPKFKLSLDGLYNSERDGGPIIKQNSITKSQEKIPSGPSATIISRIASDSPQHDCDASFFGESWYASFLLRTTNKEHNQLHQHISQDYSNHTSEQQDDAARHTKMHGTRAAASNDCKKLPSDFPPQDLTDHLITSYFSRFHAQFPILDKSAFLKSIPTGYISITLLRCVLFVASIHCDTEIIHLMGYKTRVGAGDELFNKAKLAFDADNEGDRVIMLQCSFLLHYWWGQPTSFRDSLWWLSTAIRAAECMQMHRSMKNSRISQKTKAHWKRIWWCLYVRSKYDHKR